MKTTIRKEGETLLVSIQGQLDYETTDQFKTELSRIQNDSAKNQIIFDLSELMFVGSSGISSFVQVLRDFNNRVSLRPRYTNVKNEFKRIMTAFDETSSFDFWDSNDRALRSFDN